MLCPGADQGRMWDRHDQDTTTPHTPHFLHLSSRVPRVAYERREVDIKPRQGRDVAVRVDAAELLIPVKFREGEREVTPGQALGTREQFVYGNQERTVGVHDANNAAQES